MQVRGKQRAVAGEAHFGGGAGVAGRLPVSPAAWPEASPAACVARHAGSGAVSGGAAAAAAGGRAAAGAVGEQLDLLDDDRLQRRILLERTHRRRWATR